MSDNILETLQADIHAVLRATPALALANVILNDAETTDSKIENAIKTLTTTGGKRGLALVVLRPEITEGEKNLPGPPLTLKIEIQCVEQPLLNRGADGTNVRSSQAALNVLAALHLRLLGSVMLYADKDPIKAVQVKTGYVSDAVTIYARFEGLVAAKPLGVQAEMGGGAAMTITNSGNFDGVLPLIGSYQGSPVYSNNAANLATPAPPVAGSVVIYRPSGGVWTAAYVTAGVPSGSQTALENVTQAGSVASPELVASWSASLTIAASGSSGLQLTCASPASVIRYTTDGSYPSPDANGYAGEITGLATGTVVRAAAYVTGQAPGDVLELTITE